jgi:hypothetical protein
VDEVWALLWRLQLQRACLLESKDEVAWLKGLSAYPSTMVIAETLLVNCRAYEGDVPSLIQKVLCVCQCLFCVFFNISHHTGRAIAHIYR